MNPEAGGTRVGIVSLWASILGIVLTIIVALLVRSFVNGDDEPYYMMCVLLFVGMEVIGLITGIVGRKSPAGKAGLGISLVCVVLTLLAIPIFMVRPVREASTTGQSQGVVEERALPAPEETEQSQPGVGRQLDPPRVSPLQRQRSRWR